MSPSTATNVTHDISVTDATGSEAVTDAHSIGGPHPAFVWQQLAEINKTLTALAVGQVRIDERITRIQENLVIKIEAGAELTASNIDHLTKTIENLDARLSGRIDKLDARLSGRIDKLEANVSERFEKSEVSVSDRFEKSEARASDRFQKSEARMLGMFEKAEASVADRFERSEARMLEMFEKAEASVADRFERSEARMLEMFKKAEASVADRFEKSEARMLEMFEKSDARMSAGFDILNRDIRKTDKIILYGKAFFVVAAGFAGCLSWFIVKAADRMTIGFN